MQDVFYTNRDPWHPNPGAQALFIRDYRPRYCALAGGWFAGKTWAGARKLAHLHVTNAKRQLARNGKSQLTFVKGLIVAQTFGQARTVNVPEMQRAFEELNLRAKFIADPKRYCFEFPTLGTRGRPSEILVRSADAPELISGFTVGHAWGDEVARWPTCPTEPQRDPLLQLKGRLRDPAARILQANFTFTHEGDDTDVYRDFELSPKPDHVLYRAGTVENPHAQAFADDLRRQLSSDLASQYLEGYAASLRGANVYDSFDVSRNVDASLELNIDLPLQMALDFNIAPGCHVEIGQYLPGRKIVTSVHEIHLAGMSVKHLIPELRKFLGGKYAYPGRLELFGDASGSSGNSATGESCWQILAEGLRLMEVPFTMANVPAANPHIADRVAAVNCAMLSLDGQVRYKIHPRCERLIRDYKTLKWDGNQLDKRNRDLSHASDADGYRVFQILPIRRAIAAGEGRVLLSK